MEHPKWRIGIGGRKRMGVRWDHQETQSTEEIAGDSVSIA